MVVQIFRCIYGVVEWRTSMIGMTDNECFCGADEEFAEGSNGEAGKVVHSEDCASWIGYDPHILTDDLVGVRAALSLSWCIYSCLGSAC